MQYETTTIKLLDGDIHTILAALRFYQEQGLTDEEERPWLIDDIATNGGQFDGYNDKDIDALCERLNFGLSPEEYFKRG